MTWKTRRTRSCRVREYLDPELKNLKVKWNFARHGTCPPDARSCAGARGGKTLSLLNRLASKILFQFPAVFIEVSCVSEGRRRMKRSKEEGSSASDQTINFINKVKTRFSADEHVYKAFLEILNMYRKGNKPISEMYQEVATLFSEHADGEHADLLEEFTSFRPDSSGAPVGPLLPTSRKKKYSNKPISELDMSNCERCTTSYRLLTKSYPKPICTHRTDLAREVLNDSWVSTSQSKEFKHIEKNKYEENLFRCEDDQFETDVFLESIKDSIRRVTELLETLEDPSLSKLNFEDHLTPINFRCIERIYGKHGLEVVDQVRRNDSVALPIILNRLKQKQDEVSSFRTKMNEVWAKVYAKNYHTSLNPP
uniref:Uncharacterized protein M2D3.6 n=1 Tax=Marchantia polymorpha TaxID=3197 RepID=Q8H6E1_MARPO|nr:hypothetical protein [Marchantia polymorpha]